MKRKKWKIYVINPKTGETEMISDDDVARKVREKVRGGAKKLVKKLPALGAIFVGVKMIYGAGKKAGIKSLEDDEYGIYVDKNAVRELMEEIIKENGGELYEVKEF